MLIVKGETQSTAYEQAGYSLKSNTVAAVAASNLLKNPNIQKQINDLRARLAEKTLIDLDGLTRDLLQIRSAAMAAGSYGPAVSAMVAVAKMHGFVVERSEVKVLHRPAPLPTKVLELSEDDWIRRFGVTGDSIKRLRN